MYYSLGKSVSYIYHLIPTYFKLILFICRIMVERPILIIEYVSVISILDLSFYQVDEA